MSKRKAKEAAPAAQGPAPAAARGTFPGGKVAPEPGELRVAVDKVPYAEVVGHAVVEPDVEVCGVLVGRLGEDEHGPFVHVRAAIRGQAARQAGAAVTFTHETWNHIHQEMDQRFPDDEIVGWYHTHGGFGVFLSEDDTFIHQNFFPAPHHLAYVYDPLAGSEGFFVRGGLREGAALVPLRRYWLGGRERKPAMRMPEPEPRPAASSAGPEGAPDLAAEVRKLTAAVQWSGRERAQEPVGWMAWGPWITAALALALCFVLLQRRDGEARGERPRSAALVVNVVPGQGQVVLPLVAVGPTDGFYALTDESSGLELRSRDGAVVTRFLGIGALRQAAEAEERRRLAEEQKRLEEARQANATVLRWLGWAVGVAGGLVLLAGAAWWFFLRRR